MKKSNKLDDEPAISEKENLPAISNTPMSGREKIKRIIAITVVIGLSITIMLLADKVEALGAYGYPGIFIFSVLTNATLILPAPGLILVFAMGAVLNPWWVALAAGLGASIGEVSGYMAGYSGQGIIENTKLYVRIHSWMDEKPKFAGWMILILAYIPNPLFDMAGMAAGALKIPLWRFLFWVSLGKTLKMLTFAFLGAISSPLITDLFGV